MATTKAQRSQRARRAREEALHGETTTGIRTPDDVYQWLVRQVHAGPDISQKRNVLDVSYLANILAYTTDFDPFVPGMQYSTNGVVRAACRRLVREGVLARQGYGRYVRLGRSA